MDTWQENSKFVLAEVERLSHAIDQVCDRVEEMNVKLALLENNSTKWGAIGGAIPMIAYVLIEIYRGKS